MGKDGISQIKSAKELLAEVVQKPMDYLDPRALPQFYQKFLNPATALKNEQERF